MPVKEYANKYRLVSAFLFILAVDPVGYVLKKVSINEY